METLPLSIWFTGTLIKYIQYTTSTTSNDGIAAIHCACCDIQTEKTFEEVKSWICHHHETYQSPVQ